MHLNGKLEHFHTRPIVEFRILPSLSLSNTTSNMLKHYYNEFARKSTLANESFNERGYATKETKKRIDVYYASRIFC